MKTENQNELTALVRKVDTDGDAIADVAYSVQFASSEAADRDTSPYSG
jgi:hypothetical protein